MKNLKFKILTTLLIFFSYPVLAEPLCKSDLTGQVFGLSFERGTAGNVSFDHNNQVVLAHGDYEWLPGVMGGGFFPSSGFIVTPPNWMDTIGLDFSDNEQPFTIAFWFKAPIDQYRAEMISIIPSEQPTLADLFTLSLGSNYEFENSIMFTNLRHMCENTGCGSQAVFYSQGELPIFDGQWHHLVLTVGVRGENITNNARLYLDGTLLTVEDLAKNTGKVFTVEPNLTDLKDNPGNDTPAGIHLGGSRKNYDALEAPWDYVEKNYSEDFAFDGGIDELYIFNRTLSTQEVQSLYSLVENEDCEQTLPPAVIWLTLDENAGTTLIDQAGIQNGLRNYSKSGWASGKFGSGVSSNKDTPTWIIKVEDHDAIKAATEQGYAISFWLKAFEQPQDNETWELFSKGNTFSVLQGNKVYFNVSTNDNIFNGSFLFSATVDPDTIYDGGWHHWVFSVDHEKKGDLPLYGLRVFLDGKPLEQLTFSQPEGNFKPFDLHSSNLGLLGEGSLKSSGNILFGDVIGKSDLSFWGALDDIIIFSEPLTEAAVSVLTEGVQPSKFFDGSEFKEEESNLGWLPAVHSVLL